MSDLRKNRANGRAWKAKVDADYKLRGKQNVK
jgi:hypothetical protein